MSYYQIALDGPAGAGKSTIAKELSKRLGFTFINSGGMYRCIAIALLRNNTDISNIEEVTKVLNTIDVTQNGNDLLLNGEVVTNICYTPEITRFVPTISPIPQVREACHEFQMRLANSNNIVAEGRDTTTVVFPNATLKVFVTADQLLRVLRRWEQTGKKGNFEDVKSDLINRDNADTNRAISPLKQAPDAFLLDTTNLTIDLAVETLISEFAKRK